MPCWDHNVFIASKGIVKSAVMLFYSVESIAAVLAIRASHAWDDAKGIDIYQLHGF